MICSVLLVEDNPGDALLVEESFGDAAELARFQMHHVPRLANAIEVLSTQEFDAVLLDLGLPDCQGFETLALIKAHASTAPIIVLTGSDDEVLGLKSLNFGAHDYLVKGKVFGTMLARAVLYAVQRQRTEQTLRASEAQHRLLFETMAQGAIYQDEHGRVLAANARALEYFGVSLEEMQAGRTPWRTCREDGTELDPAEHPAEIARRTGRDMNSTILCVETPAGVRRWLMVHARPHFHAGDLHPYHIFTTYTDLTAMRHAEEALRMNEERFRTLIELSHDLTYVISNDGRFTYCSPSVVKVLGYTAEELTGRPFMDVCHPEDLPAALHVWDQLVEEPETPAMYVWRGRHRDGSWRYLEAVIRNLLQEPSVRGFVANVQDVTGRHEAEDTLRAVHSRLAAVVDTSPLAILSVDAQQRVQLWNKAAEQIFGWTAEEVMGQPYPLRSPPDSPDATSLFLSAFDGATVQGAEVRRLTKSGAVVDVQLWNAQLRDTAGNVTGLVGIVADVTQQKALEEALRHAQKMEAVGRLAGGIAHDFNNILTALSGHASLLLDRLPPESSMREDLQEIEQGVARAANLTRQLLTFSRKQVMQPRVIDLVSLTQDMQKMLQRVLGEDVRLEVNTAPTSVRVEADAGQLEQVIMNLAVNARDAMPAGGRLSIDVRPAAATDPRAGGVLSEYAVLSVSDTGIGMSAEVRAKIYEPFFTTKPQGKGTGLGLPTVYGIVQRAGGFIELDSAPGAGTTFQVFLPLTHNPVTPEPPAPRPGRSGGSGVVMLVEDEPSVRNLIERVLSRRGYTVLVASSGREAAELADGANPVDLLITDVVMPEMSGVEVAAMLRRKWPSLEVLFMSGYSEEEISSRGALHEGINFLEKPFTPEQIVTKVAGLISLGS